MAATNINIVEFQNKGNLKKKNSILKLEVERPIYEEQDLRQVYQYEKPKISVIDTISKSVKNVNCKACVEKILPITYWLRKYKWQTDFISDIISGITVAIMHIPQGMAYALLGNVSPVVGIYMAFFPVLIYIFLGTSKHVSMGTFAIVCLMTGRAVSSYSTPLVDAENSNHTQDITKIMSSETNIYTPIQVATTVTFMVGIIQLIMFVCRLGIISTLLSETFVNGFTTGAAVQVFLSQIFDLLGLNLTKPRGNFKFIKTIIFIYQNIPNINTAAVIISCITCCLMIFNNELLKPWVSKKCIFPIPIELIAIVTGTLCSRYFELPKIYNIKTVGHIPVGLPEPELPVFSLLPTVILDSIGITMVSYTITMSMSIIFAKKLNYEVDSNQELFAMGASNIFASFFSCMPVSASLSRSLIQQTVGGKTQLASAISCFLLLFILLWIGPFFELLPRCVLASVIVIALQGMFVQAKEIVRFWKISKIDALVWIVTLVTTVIVNIDYGLITGLFASVISVLFQSAKPYSCLLGHVPNTDLYLDVSRYIGVAEVFGIKIFHYAGFLNFVNANQLRPDIEEKVGAKPREILKHRIKLVKKNNYAEDNDFENKCTLRCIIFDMSAITNIDSTGVEVLRDIVSEFSQIDVPVYLASSPVLVFDKIQKCDLLLKSKFPFTIFATIHDAVFFAQKELLSKSN